jgi:hypothetical protein
MMDTTTKFSSESTDDAAEEITLEGGKGIAGNKGFFGQIVQSIFEVCRQPINARAG